MCVYGDYSSCVEHLDMSVNTTRPVPDIRAKYSSFVDARRTLFSTLPNPTGDYNTSATFTSRYLVPVRNTQLGRCSIQTTCSFLLLLNNHTTRVASRFCRVFYLPYEGHCSVRVWSTAVVPGFEIEVAASPVSVSAVVG